MNIVMLLRPKSEVAYVYEDNSLRQGLEKMRRHGYTAVPVIDREGGYVGTVSEGDFLWHMIDYGDADIRKQEAYQIKNILRKDWNMPVKIDETMDELLLRVMDQNFVPVVDDRMRFMGIITRKDIIKYYYDKKDQMR
ncbi:MAG: CBS domain-containing protein [Lachnospiraceae bacterium]|uniref:CBS domain-containing protein n=1 Tax=Roseburia hominis TaxID=301301 RepID=UPI001F165985|nr:CBS domain-containing protein [Roseburia hominis]MCI5712144.1 CBS domain-containing protein [Lachnospiraceae bacterium]MDD6170452.1 CBS domain-containing protein [Lachnospiraceae bacterium]